MKYIKAVPLSFWIILLCSCAKEDKVREIDCCEKPGVSIKNITLDGHDIAVVGNRTTNIYGAFYNDQNTFEAINSTLPIVFKDQEGNYFDIFGWVVDGPRKGAKLDPVLSSKGFWFGWSTIYPNIILNDEEGGGSLVESTNEDWLISEEYVNQGALIDAIPALDFPSFENLTNKQILTSGILHDQDEIVAVKVGDKIKIYPIKILNYHEVVNDIINGEPIVVCYSPFTETSSVWSRVIEGDTLTFGVSGYVYNNNILMFDHESESRWSQLLNLCVHGKFMGARPRLFSSIQTKWATWKEIYNDHMVLTVDFDFGFDYEVNPLGDYSENENYIPFEISNLDTRLKRKDVIFGVSNDMEAQAFELSSF